jgi:hypothetical protein
MEEEREDGPPQRKSRSRTTSFSQSVPVVVIDDTNDAKPVTAGRKRASTWANPSQDLTSFTPFPVDAIDPAMICHDSFAAAYQVPEMPFGLDRFESMLSADTTMTESTDWLTAQSFWTQAAGDGGGDDMLTMEDYLLDV